MQDTSTEDKYKTVRRTRRPATALAESDKYLRHLFPAWLWSGERYVLASLYRTCAISNFIQRPVILHYL